MAAVARNGSRSRSSRFVTQASNLRKRAAACSSDISWHLARWYPTPDHIARASVRVLATVAELNKRLGDSVEKGEVVAAIESREIADAKSEYLAVRLTNGLQQTLFARQKILVESRTVSENAFLQTRLTANDAQIVNRPANLALTQSWCSSDYSAPISLA
jgi:hypothetical protein